MDLGLNGKGIIITGASRGIGLAIAESCAREGAKVSICGRTQSHLDDARARLEQHGGFVHTAVCDVSDPVALAKYIDEAAEVLGGLHGLVNNPSGFGNTDTEEGWKLGMDVDLMGVVRGTWAAKPHLIASGGGAIVNISSISGIGATTNLAYGAVKAAVIQLTQSHAQTFAPERIRVNCIAPGSIEFPGGVWDRRKQEEPEKYQATFNRIPFGRMGKPEEIGDVAAFLLSQPAYWVTGQTIAVDGAQNL